MMDADFWIDPIAWGLAIVFWGIFLIITFKFGKWPENINNIVKIVTSVVVLFGCYAMAKFQMER